MIKTNNRIIKLAAKVGSTIAISAFSLQVAAAQVRYNLNWEGQNGYTASGYFTYDDETAGSTILGEELNDFYLQAFDTHNNSLGEFVFEDITNNNNVFYFTYDSVEERILLTGESDPNGEHILDTSHIFWGFVAGKFSYDAGNFALASRIGCGSSFPNEWLPEIDLYVDSNGGCQAPMTQVDTGPTGSGISVTFAPISAVPVPAAAWLFGSGLIGLVGFSRRNK